MTVPYAIDTDPLVLGSNYEVIKVTPSNSVSIKRIYTKLGQPLQGNANVRTSKLEVEYYLHNGATALQAGTTVNGWDLVNVQGPIKGGGENASHETMSVSLEREEAITYETTITGAPLVT